MTNTTYSERPKIYKFWLIITLITGIVMVFTVAPFQSPDEFHHFYRIYQLSDGQSFGEFDSSKTDLGGYVPRSLIDVSRPFLPLVFHREIKVSVDTILTYLKTPLNDDDKIFFGFPNTARYVLTAYLPQVLTVSILKVFNTPPLLMMYLTRLTTFIFWFFIVAYAVREMPVFKELAMFFLLLPASIAINATLNADVVTNAFFFLLFMLFFQFRASKEPIPTKKLVLFSALLAITTLNKVCYFSFIGLLFCIKKEQFGSMRFKLAYIFGNLIISLFIGFMLSKKVHTLVYPNPDDVTVTTYKSLRAEYNINPDLQTARILENPLLFLTNLTRESVFAFEHSGGSWLGAFGWESTIPSGLKDGLWYFLLFFTLTYAYKWLWWERLWLGLTALSMIILFLLSTHLHWDGVGDFIESYWNGKYYIPIFPLYFFAITGLVANYIKMERLNMILGYLGLAFFLGAQIDLIIVVAQRYYAF